MKKIMMTKYGFVRSPEEDFSDDGNRFTVYKVGERVRVTKCVADGEAYIRGDIPDGKLPHKVYMSLPHYPMIGELNGISVACLTDEDLQKLYEDCLAYEKEYTDAENAIQYPSIEEITAQCKRIHAKATQELETITQLLAGTSIMALAKTLSEYEWKRLQDFLKEIDKRAKRYDSDVKIEEQVQYLYCKSISFSFCTPTYSDLSDGYYYMEVLRMLKRV
jgi:hypothetical protein